MRREKAAWGFLGVSRDFGGVYLGTAVFEDRELECMAYKVEVGLGLGVWWRELQGSCLVPGCRV